MWKWVIALLALALTGSAVAAATPGWRTAGLAQDRDTSEFAYMYFSLHSSMLNVHGLRLKSTSTAASKVDAEVECDRGETKASRKITLRITTGLQLRTLPLPIPGGHCDVDVSGSADDAGTVSIELQFR